jgi:hypothetical protein
MDLLDEPLPEGHLNPDVPAEEFFDRCEKLAATEGWKVDRRRRYAGDGYDQLNLHLNGNDDRPFVRMVATPRRKGRLDLDVVARWTGHPIPCGEYRSTFVAAYKIVLDAYKRQYGSRPRVSIGQCPPHFDRSTVDCNRLSYAREKLREALRSMAVGGGDIRERLRDAYLIFHVVRAKELPLLLQEHYRWVIEQLTWRPARHPNEGTLDATVWQMKRQTGAKIAQRIQDIADAIDELCGHSVL